MSAREAVQELVDLCHKENARWWIDPKTGEDLRNNIFTVPVKLMMVVTELSEALEGHRKNASDIKLHTRMALEVELADALIRIFDLAGAMKLDVAGALVEKMQYNRTREDHTHAHRKGHGGKAY